YQTDRPLIPFLAQDLGSLIKNLMKRIVKNEIMEKVTALSAYNVRFEDNLLDPSKVDVGFSAKRSMLSLKASDKARHTFRMECRDFIKCLLQKVLAKAPIKYTLVRNLSWLDPCKMVSLDEKDRTRASKHLEQTLHIMCDAGRVKSENCDAVKRQLTKLCDDVLASDSEAFRSFDYKSDRVDQLLHAHLSEKKEFTELWEVTQQVLLLSHSQATVERGFSIHKQTTIDNLKKESLVARRLIHQAVRNAGGADHVPLTKELLSYASSARSKYEQYLEELKRQKETEKQTLKRKATDKEVDELKTKRNRLQTDIVSMEKSADMKALDAEKYGRLPLLAES
ncbi:MAG: hypothetical protein KAH03_08580, partial [Cocleimonas sp.]|nr:hypothetical protein [Cocleimonas sp.]